MGDWGCGDDERYAEYVEWLRRLGLKPREAPGDQEDGADSGVVFQTNGSWADWAPEGIAVETRPAPGAGRIIGEEPIPPRVLRMAKACPAQLPFRWLQELHARGIAVG